MKKENKTATKVVFIVAFAIFVSGVLQLLQFIFDANIIVVTVCFVAGFFISYFGAMLEERLENANS